VKLDRLALHGGEGTRPERQHDTVSINTRRKERNTSRKRRRRTRRGKQKSFEWNWTCYTASAMQRERRKETKRRHVINVSIDVMHHTRPIREEHTKSPSNLVKKVLSGRARVRRDVCLDITVDLPEIGERERNHQPLKIEAASAGRKLTVDHSSE
jgi:hypothetical protein